MKLPWSKNIECKHLVKYQGTNIDIAGVSVPNIFSLGNVSIKTEVLQAANETIKYLDLNYLQNCETLNHAPDKESKKKCYEKMIQSQNKLTKIAMAISAYRVNTNSQKLEEVLSALLTNDSHIEDADYDSVVDTSRVEVDETQLIDNRANIRLHDESLINSLLIDATDQELRVDVLQEFAKLSQDYDIHKNEKLITFLKLSLPSYNK